MRNINNLLRTFWWISKIGWLWLIFNNPKNISQNQPVSVIHQKCFQFLKKSWVLRIYWCPIQLPNSIPSPVFKIRHFCNKKNRHNQRNLRFFTIKVIYCGHIGAKTNLKSQILWIFQNVAIFAKMSQNNHFQPFVMTFKCPEYILESSGLFAF